MKRLSSPTPVGAILPAALPGLGEWLLEARVRQEWETLMGQDVARRAQPFALSHGVLQVAVTNSPWLQELTLREPDLRRRLADRYGADAIRALRFYLGTLPIREATNVKRQPSAPESLTVEEARMIEAATQALTDSPLAAAARRLLAKALLARRPGRGPGQGRNP